MRKGIGILAALALTLSTSAALANVIDPAVDKANAKLRSDVGNQVAKYTFCLVKAAAKCEGKGLNSGVECHLDTGVVDYDPMDAQTKFQAAIAKCDSKVNLSKKGTDYVGIGCPGDCNSVAAGTQECANMAGFQASLLAVSGAKTQLGLLAVGVDVLCATDTGNPDPTSDVRKDCVTDNVKVLTKYAQAAFKCEGKCQNDFKNKKGNGGPNNGPNCLAGNGGADANFNACVNKALTKVTSPVALNLISAALNKAVNDAVGGLYDRFDPTSTPEASPCGTCGDATRAGAEECDGADAAACPGLCKPDCTCP